MPYLHTKGDNYDHHIHTTVGIYYRNILYNTNIQYAYTHTCGDVRNL